MYDYAIIGAGAAGLLLADALGNDAFFKDKSILLIDKTDKSANDRTWCFWEKGAGPFDDILYKSWPKIRFTGITIDQNPTIAPYAYKMLRGVDFYQHYLQKIATYPNLHFVVDEVLQTTTEDDFISLNGQKENYKVTIVFDSRLDYQKLQQTTKYPLIQQHFLGWFIKTDRSAFDAQSATFMDFSVAQQGNTRFMYLLPLSDREALVEYTLFSETPLKKAEYEAAIQQYLSDHLGIKQYEITEVEQGNIPMSCHAFEAQNTNSLLKIGIAGGWAKASTGYTFYHSVKKVQELLAHLKTGKDLRQFAKKTRFWYYDLLLLDILYKHNHLGRSIFEALFKKRSPQLIFKFLDEETTLWEEIKIIAAPHPLPFIRALLGRLFSFGAASNKGQAL